MGNYFCYHFITHISARLNEWLPLDVGVITCYPLHYNYRNDTHPFPRLLATIPAIPARRLCHNTEASVFTRRTELPQIPAVEPAGVSHTLDTLARPAVQIFDFQRATRWSPDACSDKRARWWTVRLILAPAKHSRAENRVE